MTVIPVNLTAEAVKLTHVFGFKSSRSSSIQIFKIWMPPKVTSEVTAEKWKASAVADSLAMK